MTLEATTQRARAAEILDVAERLVQTRGFNAFSYADIAAELGVTKPALHYHYGSKAELGEALVARYAERFFSALDVIASESGDARARLTRYVELYRNVLVADRMCLCGILAAEHQTLPAGVRDAVLRFFDRNEIWLESVLRDGHARGELTRAEPLDDTARLIIDTLEGAMMIARACDDPRRFERAATRLLSTVLS